MITTNLGQTEQGSVPLPVARQQAGRPAAANPNFRPQALKTAFFSHFQPFRNVLGPLTSRSVQLPQLPGVEQPGVVESPARVPGAPAPTIPGAATMARMSRRGSVDVYRAMRTGVLPGARMAPGGGQTIAQQLPAVANQMR